MADTTSTLLCVPPPAGSVAFDPLWRTETVRMLARSIEADRAFDRLPILADALQEAGCEDGRILNHCRSCALHGSQCWVLGLIRNARPRQSIVEWRHPPDHTPRPAGRHSASPVLNGVRWATLAVTLLLSVALVVGALVWSEGYLCLTTPIWAMMVIASMVAISEMD